MELDQQVPVVCSTSPWSLLSSETRLIPHFRAPGFDLRLRFSAASDPFSSRASVALFAMRRGTRFFAPKSMANNLPLPAVALLPLQRRHNLPRVQKMANSLHRKTIGGILE